MKHILSTPCRKMAAVAAALLCAAAIHGAYAQNTPSNHIQTKTFTSAGGSSYYQDVTFYDGLGYGVQSLQVAGSPLGHTLSSQTVYDSMHRPDSVTCLPYTRTDGSASQVAAGPALSAQADWYDDNAHGYDDTRPFAVKAYETSRYGRPLSLQREGDRWNAGGGHRVSFTYGFNDSGEEILRLKYEPAVTSGAGSHPPRVSCCETWPFGALSLTRTTDEAGAVSDTYTDPSGRTVCTRSWAGHATTPGGPGTGAMSQTLYAYDHRDSLVLVVQPEGAAALASKPASSRVITLGDDPAYANNAIYREYCFCYDYDGWGNLISEHVPGGGTTRYAYDARDRRVLQTDSLMSPAAGSACRMVWTVYDSLDRVTAERYVESDVPLESLRAYASGGSSSDLPSSVTSNFESQVPLRLAQYFPFGTITYASSGDGAFTPDSGVAAIADLETERIRGFLRQETVYPAPNPDGTVAADAPSVTRYYHYDYRGRVIQTKEFWSDGRARRVSTKYSFTGDVLATKETVSIPVPAEGGGTTAKESSLATFYTRDPRGRVLTCSRVLDGTDTLATVHYAYDELGRLAGKTVGDTNFPLLETYIDYDLHGWTTAIDVAVADEVSGSMNAVFSETLSYADTLKDASACRYDGNIAETAFAHRVDGPGGTPYLQTDTWSYFYDGLKRLTDASHYSGAALTPSLTDTERGIVYDLNGNITALKRYASSGPGGDLTFTHTGNRMTSVTNANATGNDAGPKAFTYDANGNMTSDGRKGLELTWNILNLVDSAAMHGSSLKYAWLSDGTKVSAKADDGSGNGVQKRYLGSFVLTSNTEHSADEATEVESIAWDEGRIIVTAGSPATTWATSGR